MAFDSERHCSAQTSTGTASLSRSRPGITAKHHQIESLGLLTKIQIAAPEHLETIVLCNVALQLPLKECYSSQTLADHMRARDGGRLACFCLLPAHGMVVSGTVFRWPPGSENGKHFVLAHRQPAPQIEVT
jgi:hypothetical protein